MIITKEPLECDVFVAGGGVGGLMAAIAAADKGAKVILAEKANTKRSGCGATGTDHFLCYIPEIHGSDPGAFIAEMELSQVGGKSDMNIVRRYASESFDRVRDWDRWGIPMRPHGDWEFNGHAMPGHLRIWLKYAGQNQKPVLTKQALKRGVEILNHHPFTDLITNEEGRVIGAMCLDLTDEEPKIQVIRAKSVVLATGGGGRLYGSKYMGWMFNVAMCPASTYTGRAAAFRAGARLVNMDSFGAPAGCTFFNRGGKATWIGIYSDMDGKPLGPFATKPTKEYGDMAGDIWREMFTIQRAKGEPVFMNCTEASDEDLDFMLWGLENEGNSATLQYLKEEGFDFRRHMVEFTKKGQSLSAGCGIDINDEAETTLKGLYAAGDETGSFRADLGGAAVIGHIAGRNAARHAKTAEIEPAEESPIVAERAEHYTKIFTNERDCSTPDWKEVNIGIQQVMSEYCGMDVQSDRLLTTGLQHLKRIQRKAENMHCDDTHTFLRCLETEDIALIGEIVINSVLERKESRGNKKRVDHPYTNTLLNGKFVTAENSHGEIVTGWRNKVK